MNDKKPDADRVIAGWQETIREVEANKDGFVEIPRKQIATTPTQAMDNKTLIERLQDILPLLKDLETGQDCAEYAFAKGDGFQAMTYCPDAFEALRVLPKVIAFIEAQATRIGALEAALRRIKDATANEMRAGDKGYVSRYGIHGIATKALDVKDV